MATLSPYSFNLQGGYPQPGGGFGTINHGPWVSWTYGSDPPPADIVLETPEILTGTYSTSGGIDVWAHFDVSTLNTNELWIEFDAKMPLNQHGLKFLKIFGKRSGSNYSNLTFGCNYTTPGGPMSEVSFGDGASITNDTQKTIRYNGDAHTSRAPSPVISTPQNSNFVWDTEWHTFRFHLKYNSGTTAINEVADGELYLEIDGNVYVDATGLFNRYYDNQTIDYVGFFDYTQDVLAQFSISYRNPRISTVGFS